MEIWYQEDSNAQRSRDCGERNQKCFVNVALGSKRAEFSKGQEDDQQKCGHVTGRRCGEYQHNYSTPEQDPQNGSSGPSIHRQEKKVSRPRGKEDAGTRRFIECRRDSPGASDSLTDKLLPAGIAIEDLRRKSKS